MNFNKKIGNKGAEFIRQLDLSAYDNYLLNSTISTLIKDFNEANPSNVIGLIDFKTLILKIRLLGME